MFFFHGIDFVFAGIGISIAVRAIAAVRGSRYRHLPQNHQPALLEDPRVPHLQAEVEELRTQVERLAATETFYAQLNAPATGAPALGTPRPAERPAG